jgi:hypothetical protein
MTTINIKGWKHELQTVTIKDKTHLPFRNDRGERVPTFLNMERRLKKALRDC